MEQLLNDLRFGARILWKKPGFTLVAVLTLSLGIGANAAILSLIDVILWRPLAVRQPERLTAVYTTAGGGTGFRPLSYLDYLYYRDHQQSFAGLAAYARVPVRWQNGNQIEQLGTELVTGNFFEVVGLRAVRGRLLNAEDDRTLGAHPVAVISHRFWQQRFNAAPDVVGSTINLNGHDFTIIGIAPPTFSSLVLDWGKQPDVWTPMMMQPQILPTSNGETFLQNRDSRWLLVVGRMRDSVAFNQAAAEINLLAAQQASAWPQHNAGRAGVLLPLSQARFWPEYRQEIIRLLTVLEIIAAMVLLIACFNVANLLLTRATARRQEMGIRLAMGASAWRLVRLVLTESLLLALLGAGAGLLVASGLMELLASYQLPFRIPLAINLQLDSRTLLFTLLAALLTSLLCGLAPALRALKLDPVASIKERRAGIAFDSGIGKLTSRNLFVVAQMALSLVLLVGAALLARSLWQLRNMDLGFQAERILLVSFQLDPRQFTAERQGFYQQLLDRVRALPGVEAASLTKNVPINRGRMKLPPIAAAGREPSRPEDWLNASPDYVSPGYFQTLGITLQQGRDFDQRDTPGAEQAVIINRTLADKLWPQQNALGRRLKFLGEAKTATVIGVAPDVKYRSLTDPPEPYYYLAATQHYFGEMTLQVRTAGEPFGLVSAVRETARATDHDAFISDVSTINNQLQIALSQPRMAATFAGLLGLLALLLATLGLYSVMSFVVAQRTNEMGIRLALGAQPRDLLKLILVYGARLACVGVGIGLLGAYLATRLLTSLLYGVNTTDLLTFISVTALLIFIALLACWIPARRATKVDPLIALRSE